MVKKATTKVEDTALKPEGPVEAVLNPPVPEATVPPKKEEETIEIKRTDFDKMMKQLETQSKDISLLMKTADKGRIAKELNKAGENLIKRCNVRTWDDTGKIIVGWKLITNRCEVVQGRWTEDQTCSMIFEDGTILTVPLLEFYRKTLIKVPVDIIARTEELDASNNKVVILKLQFPTGKILLLNSVFIN